MSTSAFPDDNASLHALRRFIYEQMPMPTPTVAHTAEEHCEMCAAPLASEHRHMLDLAHHKLLCACQACALLFAPRGTNADKYQLIPQRYLALLDFQMTDWQWNELMLPVNMVYIFHSSEFKRTMAFYPSPAGATESLLNLEHWQTLLAANPILEELEPDVEALLINRVEHTRAYYIVPIDVCYRLVGLLRRSWHGLSGGSEVKEALATFFAELAAKALPAHPVSTNAYARRPGLAGQNLKGGNDART